VVCLCALGGCLSQDLEGQFNEAAILYAHGNFGAAAGLYHRILKLSPRHPDALFRLALIAQHAGKSPLALMLLDEAIGARPQFSEAHFNRSVILRALGRGTESETAARLAIEYDPHMAEAWDMIGQIMKDQGAFDKAAACFECAINLQPRNAHFHGNYALLLFAQNELSKAYSAALRAHELDPTWPPGILGNITQGMGYPELAVKYFERARALRPDFPDAFASEAMARLQIGQMKAGWTLWEKRPDLEKIARAIPLWQGQIIEHLFLYEDQGLGDAIQFARYLPLLKGRVRRLTLRAHPSLAPLFEENFPEITIVTENDFVGDADARCRLSSLPYFFNTTLETIPQAPYLKGSSERRQAWREILRPLKAPRIGLVIAGNIHFHHDRSRSLPLQTLSPLLSFGLGHFVSLQKDRALDPLALSSKGILDAAPRLKDFADTAALIDELDLVITVDTATAHLAGACGKPVFILLPFASDWRWLLSRSTSPWYGSARLFRQQKPGDWAFVIESVIGEIKKLIGGDLSVLNPSPEKDPVALQNPFALPLPSN